MRYPSRPIRMLSVAGLLAVAALSTPALASAHSFLVRSDPAAGARLTRSPALIAMYFSEPFVAGSEHVSVTRSGGCRGLERNHAALGGGGELAVLRRLCACSGRNRRRALVLAWKRCVCLGWQLSAVGGHRARVA